jgi:predicted CXXCH cytochrome family protein
MGCHDGSLAREAGGMRMGSGFFELGQAQPEHPVPVQYRETRESHLKPAAALDSRIHLFNGQVGCTSCHSPFSREKGLLVMSNQKSRLCVACHGR